MPDLSPQIETAQRLLKDFGRPVRLEQLGPPAGIPRRATVRASLDVDALFVGPASLGLEGHASDLLRRAEQIALVAPGAEVNLLDYDQLRDGDVVWKIEGVEVFRPGPQTVVGYVSVKR